MSLSSISSNIQIRSADAKTTIEIFRQISIWSSEHQQIMGSTWNLENLNLDFLSKLYGAEAKYFTISVREETAGAFVLSDNVEDIWQKLPAKHSLYLHKLTLLPQFRGLGFVEMVFNFAKQHARENHYANLRLDTGAHQPGLVKLYEKQGFVVVGKFLWTTGDTGLLMEYEL